MGSCSKTSCCGLQILPWLIEPQTTKCLKNEADTLVLVRFGVRCESIGAEDPAGLAKRAEPAVPTPAGRVSRAECSQLSASIQRSQIQFLCFLNQFLGYKWKGEKATMMLPRIKAVAGLETPQNPTHWRKLFCRHLNPLHFCIE